MGFGHEWKLAKKYDEQQWEEIKVDAYILFKALPAVAKQRAVHDMKIGFWGLVAGAVVLLSDRKHPVRGKYDGSLFGKDESGASSVGFSPYSDNLAGAFDVEVPNSSEVRSAKTGTKLYDHLRVVLLCLCEEKKAGNVKVKSTDGEPDYWEHIADWASKVLGRELPMPRAVEGSAPRHARIEAVKLSKVLVIPGSSIRERGFKAQGLLKLGRFIFSSWHLEWKRQGLRSNARLQGRQSNKCVLFSWQAWRRGA